MDFGIFWKRVRADKRLGVSRLTQVQVDVGQMLIVKGAGLRLEALAYVLATAWGEAKLTPVRENMNYSADRIRQVWPSRFPTAASAAPYARNPKKLANKVYNGRMGNAEGSNDGWTYRGGGLDQLTGAVNYERRGLKANPDAILNPDTAARSIITGMTLGDYRGPKLADFFNATKTDPVGARAIINADVSANGNQYAAYWSAFRDALAAAGYGSVNLETAAVIPQEKPAVPKGTIQPMLAGVVLTVLVLAYFLMKG